jgi:hypothetical protein
MFQQLEE